MKWGARFCPACGAYQNPPADRRARVRLTLERWRLVKGTIYFYLVILGTTVPLFWIPEEHLATAMLVASMIDAVIILVYWQISRTTLGPQFVLTRPAVVWTAIGVAALIPMIAVNLAYHGAVVRYFGLEVRAPADPYTLAGYPFWVIVLSICVMPAIWEEIAFRGIIQAQLGKAVRGREAIVLTAVLFAIIHRSVISGFYLFALGLLLGVLRKRSDSLVPTMVVHFCHNFAVVLLEEAGS